MPFITKTELAVELGITTPRVYQLIKSGLPVREDGRFDRDKSIEWVANNIRPRGEQPKAGEENFYEAKRRKEVALANLREHELAVKRGEFIPKEDDRAAWASILGRFRSRMLAIPTRAAPLLAAETNMEGYRQVLERLIDEGLQELSETPIDAIKHSGAGKRTGYAGSASPEAEDS